MSAMSSKTRLTNFEKLAAKGELGIVLGRLMLALNDIGVANDALGTWIGVQTGIRKDRQAGAKMYFVRMLISHVFEGLAVISKIKSNTELMKAVESSGRPTQVAFSKCAAVIGTERYKLMKRVRNDLGFHYLDETVRAAIASQSEKAPELPLSLSVGHDPLEWYYQPGDRIVDSAIVRDIFKISEGADVQKEVDGLIHDMQAVGDNLAEFSGYFVMENAI
jgi:hypothetical protein